MNFLHKIRSYADDIFLFIDDSLFLQLKYVKHFAHSQQNQAKRGIIDEPEPVSGE